jgi:hypothetical protein
VTSIIVDGWSWVYEDVVDGLVMTVIMLRPSGSSTSFMKSLNYLGCMVASTKRSLHALKVL